MIYRNNMNPAWRMMALSKLNVEERQSVFDALLIWNKLPEKKYFKSGLRAFLFAATFYYNKVWTI